MRKAHLLAATTFLLTASLFAASVADQQEKIRVRIRPECKVQFYFLMFEADPDKAAAAKPDVVEVDETYAKPLAFRDPRTQITFYVESDGRHLAALDAKGKLLWVSNPFEDAMLCPYRYARPVISKIETASPPRKADIEGNEVWGALFKEKGMDISHRFIRIHFDSSQFGLVDQTNGAFIIEGQN